MEAGAGEGWREYWRQSFDGVARHRHRNTVFTARDAHAAAIRGMLQDGCAPSSSSSSSASSAVAAAAAAGGGNPSTLVSYDALALRVSAGGTGGSGPVGSLARVLGLMLRLQRYSHICFFGIDALGGAAAALRRSDVAFVNLR